MAKPKGGTLTRLFEVSERERREFYQNIQKKIRPVDQAPEQEFGIPAKGIPETGTPEIGIPEKGIPTQSSGFDGLFMSRMDILWANNSS